MISRPSDERIRAVGYPAARLETQIAALREAVKNICHAEEQFWQETRLSREQIEMDELAKAVKQARALLAQIEEG